jgi:hypothetical protein
MLIGADTGLLLGTAKGQPRAQQLWANLMAGAERAAGYRHGLGLSTVDSIIPATFVIGQCDLPVTADSDFHIVSQQNIVEVELLR